MATSIFSRPFPSLRVCFYIQNIKPGPKQHCRSISQIASLSHHHCPASLRSHQARTRAHPEHDSTPHSCEPDWNSNDEFFKFTRGRFIVDEAENLRKREIRFDLNKLASIAGDSIGAKQCISIKKYPDGMFNKAFLMSMDDGREVVAKVPNPNAGVPHFTTASEVATMDFARKVLGTPAPRVYSWNSQAKSHPVGAEFIIMEKIEGVPLSQVWDTMLLPQKLQVLLAMTRLQNQWLSVSFSHYGSLYYAGDVPPPVGNHYVKNGNAVKDSEFAIGPSTGRDWADAGRSNLDTERGPWATPAQYLQAARARETKAIHSLKPPKQIALFCGSRLYQPNTEKKLTALAQYQQIINALIPTDTTITNPYLWHNDLHDDNIFVDPHNPEKITGIIDWQSCHVSPLFTHSPDPAFLAWDGLEPETLDLVPRPDLSGLSPEESSAAVHEYSVQNVFIGWRKLMHAKNPDLYRVVEFCKTAAYGLIFLAHRMFEYGEAHFQALLVDLKDTWADLPAVTNDMPFPFNFSEAEIERIKRAGDNAVAGTELVTEVRETMGDLWPDKSFIEHDRYDYCKAALDEVRDQLVEQLAGTEEEKDEYKRCWPFE
ncbi:phosphotransferase enzyme family protein [Byssothecium circinans]|uniref:Altered inheritance of mitochondria protein 9, mitochondrial n=1 Tax=Byssothecium circinans TaxID=147558 RepID=A0A6A5UI87_9PLEO|nr:phosphotransferase enzyme family protein [Byssothecium circinans]